MTHEHWEPVIGLEIHAELNTKSKLFSNAPNRFGDEPNTNISVVCTGQPGALPVLNKEAVKKTVQFGCAINATVCKFSKFDRKSYFYPDSPRNFQITQFEEPIVKGGKIIAEVEGVEQSFDVNRVHIEDDAGMLKHFPTFAGVDYNRAGVPLIEIVSEPCMHSAKEAVAYAQAVKAILEYIDASDCNMEEGSLRFDVNVSVRKKGELSLRNKIEIKNLNSFNYLEQSIEAEISRQVREYTLKADLPQGEVVQQATYRWDVENKETVLMRRKEQADDYRYFPEPDLVPIILTDAYIEEIRSKLPELPLQRERRYVQDLGLPPHTAFTLTYDKPTADYFEEALKFTKNGKSLANWIIVEFAGRYKESGKTLVNSGIPAAHVGTLVHMIESGVINGKIGKSIVDEMVLKPSRHPQEIVDSNPDFKPLNDAAAIEKIVDAVLEANPQSIIDYKAGRDKAFAFLVGQVMKQTSGKASPPLVNELLKLKMEKNG
jgi:aspartyl-tRNA(Asn)/glutamyl-tRNA(Gln) amidotransferase subunit B